MRWLAVVFAGVVLAVAGCAKPVPATATVTGTYIRVGGPPGTPNMPLPGTITFRDPNGATSTFNSDSTGRFTGHLPPGAYTVTATSSLINDGKSQCSQPLTARLQADKTVTLTLICGIM
jgi:hypothetical protein